jgi:hypothetical protein
MKSMRDALFRAAGGMMPASPVVEALSILEETMQKSKEQGYFTGSPILQSTRILLDHTKKTRKALWSAVRLVDKLEDQGEWSPEKSKNLLKNIAEIKEACVSARLHQIKEES